MRAGRLNRCLPGLGILAEKILDHGFGLLAEGGQDPFRATVIDRADLIMVRSELYSSPIAVHDFIDTPLFPVEYLLTVRANDPVQVRDWADVRALGEQGVVLSLHGFAGILSHMRSVGGLRIDAGGRDTKVNLEKLLAGRGRFFIHRSPGVYGDIARSGLQDKVRVLPAVMYAEVFYLMVARSMPQDVKDKINHALARLAGNGELARITRLWSERPDDKR